jgi:hypothetical protein
MDLQTAPLKQQNVDTSGRDHHISAQAFPPAQGYSIFHVVKAQDISVDLHSSCKITTKEQSSFWSNLPKTPDLDMMSGSSDSKALQDQDCIVSGSVLHAKH